MPDKTEYIKDAPIAPAEILKKLPELQKDDFTVTEKVGKGGERLYTISKRRKKVSLQDTSFNGQPGIAQVGPKEVFVERSACATQHPGGGVQHPVYLTG